VAGLALTGAAATNALILTSMHAIKITIRLIITAILLVIVSQHAHWSVTASMTLLAINAEFVALIIRRF
jgi:hypothetical protein